MRRIPLPGTTLSVSRFALGTASLHHIGSASAQADHLRAAASLGFSHFDTAPIYGFGAAERALGAAFSTTSAAKVTIGTKVGLYPPGGTSQSRAAVLGRKALGRIFAPLSRAEIDWGVARARGSLDESLRRLRRDRVDILLLHEPELGLLASDELLRWLKDEAGQRIVSFGISGHAHRLEPFVTSGCELARVVQTQDSIEGREADFMAAAGRSLQLTYGYLSAAPLGSDAKVTLSTALAHNPTGSVIVSTRNRARLATFATIENESRAS